MRSLSEAPSIISTETQGTSPHRGARLFTAKLIRVAYALWPRKTAEHLAMQTHCSIRAAKNYLSGRRELPGAAVRAIIRDELE